MPVLQRKIFSEISVVSFISLLVILVLILMGRALQLRDMLFGLNVSLEDTLMLFVYMSPTFFQLAAPIACMIGIFVVFLRMENDREIIALKAGGLSLYQLLPAPILFSIIITAITFWVALFGISWGMDKFRDSIMNIATNKAQVVVQPGVFNKEIPGLVFYARQVDPGHALMKQIIVQDSSSVAGNTQSAFTILAPEGNIETDSQKGELLFVLKNGKMYSDDDENTTVLAFNEYIIRVPLNSLFSGLDLGVVKPKEMSWTSLAALPVEEVLLTDTRLGNKIIVEKHKRFIFPFACLVLGLMAIPMAVLTVGMKKQFGMIYALIVFVVYYGILSMGIGLGESGTLSPYLGLWLPNAFFILLCCWGIYRAASGIHKG